MPDTYKWGTVDMLPDGHRIFPSLEGEKIDKLALTGKYAIADNSGREPQDTTDGILWLDFDWNLIISSPDNVLCIPVKRQRDDERFSTVTDMATLLYLSAMYEWPIEEQHTNTIYSVTKESK